MNGVFTRLALLTIALVMLTACGVEDAGEQDTMTNDYPIVPVPFTRVSIVDDFWRPRIEMNRLVTIPYALEMCEKTGRIDNLRKAAGLMEGDYQGKRFNDSDVFKAMEGVAYSLAMHPDPDLEARMDELIAIIAQAQEEDGYLYSARTVDPDNPAPGAGKERWIHLAGSHELYNAGHMYEAAVAYYQATGKRAFLNVAIRNAELLLDTFGPEKRLDRSGHQEIEIGLPKLFRVTGDRRYLELAKFFLDQRGNGERTGELYPEDTIFAIYNDPEHVQDHIPVLEQTEAVGHAVRAAYQYAAMADIAALSGDQSYIDAIKTIWRDVTERKLYITGGIGARHEGESFGPAYYLPNDSAYAETCAAVGNVFWNQRMFLLTGDGSYIDVLERSLYNGLLAGVSLDANRFFYVNPLESEGGVERQEWFEVSCCPTNIIRFLPSLPGYVYASDGETIYVILFARGVGVIDLPDGRVKLRQTGDYPWRGDVGVEVEVNEVGEFTLAVRIPGWARGIPSPGGLYSYASEAGGYSLQVNGEPLETEPVKGYVRIKRNWRQGDVVALELQMPVRLVKADDRVAANRGKVAVERGPLVYCLEEVDADRPLDEIRVRPEDEFQLEFNPGLLGGIYSLTSAGMRLVPYYSWAHRGAGAMKVWLDLAE